MRTTVDLPDHLMRSLKIRASLRGVPLKQVMASVIAAGLRTEPEPGARRPRELPVAIPPTGKRFDITTEKLRELDDREDLERYERSFGRQRVVGPQRS